MANVKPAIKYTSREFDTIKQDFVQYARRYYPEVYRDFNEASFGSLMLDTVSYVGDVLSFYLDYQVNESFLDSAAEFSNVVRLSKQLGYKHRGAASSTGTCAFFCIVPANDVGLGPNTTYLPILKKGSTAASDGGVNFILEEDVFFNDPNNQVVAARVDASTGLPPSYAIKAFGRVVSGEMAKERIAVGDFVKSRIFHRCQISIKRLIGIY